MDGCDLWGLVVRQGEHIEAITEEGNNMLQLYIISPKYVHIKTEKIRHGVWRFLVYYYIDDLWISSIMHVSKKHTVAKIFFLKKMSDPDEIVNLAKTTTICIVVELCMDRGGL